MSNKLACLLLILFTAGQATAQAELAFTIVDTMISWASTLYSTVDSATDKTSENVDKILSNVDKLSSQLDTVAIQTDTKLDAILSTLINDVEVTTELQHQTTQLLERLHRIDHYHEDSSKYKVGKSYANNTLREFTNSVLYDTDNLPKTLREIYDIFNPGPLGHLRPGFLEVIATKTRQNLPTDCQRHISPQQSIFYLYVQLMLAEARALATLKSVYTIMWWLEESANNYTAELDDAKNVYDSDVREYHRIFSDHMALYPLHLYRCHINVPRRDVDYFELEKFSRVTFFKTEYSGFQHCTDPPSPPRNIFGTPPRYLYSCTQITGTITTCPAESESSRDLLWFHDEAGTYYGHSGTCPRQTDEIFEKVVTVSYTAGVYGNSHKCPIYACSGFVTGNERSDRWRISTLAQITDILDNKVVTGVRFIVEDKTIYLQIQEAKFSKSGMVYEDVVWKDLSVSDNRNVLLDFDHRTMYFDDVTVPDDYVVTGVQWGAVNGIFQLAIRATAFDFYTGALNVDKTVWCRTPGCVPEGQAGDYAREYARDRVEIDMGEADDPLRGAEFNYDTEGNEMIKFTNTDLRKDASQTTIPFLDAQPVQAVPPFPLSGVRVIYRGRKGFGGYIAPQIKTFNLTREMAKPPKN